MWSQNPTINTWRPRWATIFNLKLPGILTIKVSFYISSHPDNVNYVSIIMFILYKSMRPDNVSNISICISYISVHPGNASNVSIILFILDIFMHPDNVSYISICIFWIYPSSGECKFSIYDKQYNLRIFQ